MRDKLLGEDDRVGQLAHGAAEAAAFVAHSQVRFLFGQILSALQDALGTLDRFARFELALHVLGLGGEATFSSSSRLLAMALPICSPMNEMVSISSASARAPRDGGC